MLQRHPVLELNLSSTHCLSELVRGTRSLSSVSPRQGCHVRETLNRIGCVLEADTGNGERTNRVGHLGEVVDGLICILVQLIKSSIDLVQSGTILTGVGQNGLDGVDLGLVFFETIDCRLDEALEHRLTRAKSRCADSAKSRDANSLHDGHVGGSIHRRSSQITKGCVLSDLAHSLETICSALHLQGFLKSVHSGRGFLDSGQELLVIHLERDYPLVNSRHYLVTSFQAFFAILSNTGLIAGLM